MRLTAAAAAAAFMLLPLAGCSGTPEPAKAASLSPTPSAAASKEGLDSHARVMCEQLDEATRVRTRGGNMAEFDAGILEYKAITSAKSSTVGGVNVLVRDFTGEDDTGEGVEQELRWWCQKNWTPGS